jgi:hypothetical protein
MGTKLTRSQKEALAWALQCAIVDGLGGESGGSFSDLADDEPHPELGITWNQAMQQIAVWLNRLPGGLRHEEFVFARAAARSNCAAAQSATANTIPEGGEQQ